MCKNETLWKTAFLYETSVRSSNVECTNSQCIYRGSLAISLQSPLDNPSKRDVYFIDLGVSMFVKLLASFFCFVSIPSKFKRHSERLVLPSRTARFQKMSKHYVGDKAP